MRECRGISDQVFVRLLDGAFNARVKSDWKLLLLLRSFFKYSPCFDDPASARS